MKDVVQAYHERQAKRLQSVHMDAKLVEKLPYAICKEIGIKTENPDGSSITPSEAWDLINEKSGVSCDKYMEFYKKTGGNINAMHKINFKIKQGKVTDDDFKSVGEQYKKQSAKPKKPNKPEKPKNPEKPKEPEKPNNEEPKKPNKENQEGENTAARNRKVVDGRRNEYDIDVKPDGKKFNEDDYTQDRLNNAVWIKDKYSDERLEKSRSEFEDYSRKIMKDAEAGEYDAVRAITGTAYSGIASQLYSGKNYHEQNTIDNLSSLIAKSEMQKDTWLERGCRVKDIFMLYKSHDEMDTLHIDPDDVDFEQFVGKVGVNKPFAECGSAKGSGYNQICKMNIYCPKGTNALYVGYEGASKYPSENETILQCGTKLQLARVEKVGGQYYFDFLVVGLEDRKK